MDKGNIEIVFDWKNVFKVFVGTLFISLLIAGTIFVFSKVIKSKSEKVVTNEVSPSQPPEVKDLVIEDIILGTGEEVSQGDTVKVHYKGSLLDGSVFDSSVEGKPFEFRVGAGEVIPGWDKGILGMKKGGKRKLTIPPNLAYGSKEMGKKIPPNSTLVFEIELKEINKP